MVSGGRSPWPDRQSLERVVATTATYWSGTADGIRVDLVVDPLSAATPRPRITIEGSPVSIDVLENIGPNKIGALVFRGEPRDAIDCYVLYWTDHHRFLSDYAAARTREALLDDILYARERFLLVAEEAEDVLAAHAADLGLPIEAAHLALTFEAWADLLTPGYGQRGAPRGN